MGDLTLPYSLRFFIALGLSFLIGLERESSGAKTKGIVFAGVRTYSLIGTYGFGCAWLVSVNVPWALPMGMMALGALALAGYLAKLKTGHVGWTSEVAAMLTFVIGALCLLGDIWVPMALGIVGTFLLSEKAKLESYVERLDKAEFLAVIKFLLVSLIILPVLPNEEYTEFRLNPRHIWQIVVLVSAIGFGGYFLTKKFGSRIGLWLSGLLGGIVSSTAVSFAVGRIAQQQPSQGFRALQASILAGSVMYLRILVLIWLISPKFIEHVWWQLLVLSAIGFMLSFQKGIFTTDKAEVGPLRNPFEIKPALIFATLFVLMSVATVLMQKVYGNAGVMVLAGVIGVTDIDPFILSLVGQEGQVQTLIVSAILVSMMSNTIMKGIYFGVLSKTTRVSTALRYGIWALLHIPLILFWR